MMKSANILIHKGYLLIKKGCLDSDLKIKGDSKQLDPD